MGPKGGTNWVAAAWRAGATMLRTFWKLARQLFHETAGTLFALFAIYTATAAWKQIRQPGGVWVGAVAAAYAALMVFFSIWSFRSARRVR